MKRYVLLCQPKTGNTPIPALLEVHDNEEPHVARNRFLNSKAAETNPNLYETPTGSPLCAYATPIPYETFCDFIASVESQKNINAKPLTDICGLRVGSTVVVRDSGHFHYQQWGKAIFVRSEEYAGRRRYLAEYFYSGSTRPMGLCGWFPECKDASDHPEVTRTA